MNQFATLKLKNFLLGLCITGKPFVCKHCFAVFPNNDWVVNDNAITQLFTLKGLSKSTYLT